MFVQLVLKFFFHAPLFQKIATYIKILSHRPKIVAPWPTIFGFPLENFVQKL